MGTSKRKPELLAVLICEQALLDEDKVASLLRVIDTFTLDIEVSPQAEHELDRIAVNLQCFVFTKWGIGEGDFVEELVLVYPNGTEDAHKGRVPFTLPGSFHFQQIRHRINLTIAEAGIYAWRIYLDGERVREHPFKVDVTKRALRRQIEQENEPERLQP